MSAFTDLFTPLSFPNLGLVRFPEIVLSPQERARIGVSERATNRVILKKLAWNGYLALRAKGRFNGIEEQTVIDRFKAEFETFDKTGVHDYLLLVWDINRWCDEEGIVRGYGRGSAGGSLTLYTLGVTRMNPFHHEVDFTRFISEARLKPVIKDGVTYVDGKAAPDIDCDYQYLRRADVVRYIEARFPGRVSKISTRLELTGKMALKNVLKVYGGYSDEEAQVVSDLVEARFGKVQPLTGGTEKKPSADQNPAVIEWRARSQQNDEMYRMAVSIEGLTVAHGQHPSGVAICYDLIDGNIPVELSRAKEVVTSYDMETVAGLLVKLDILGLRTLDLVAETARLVGVEIDDLDVNDPLIYQSLPTHDRYLGLFQIAEGVTKEATRRIAPRNVDELGVVLSISRPGAMSQIPAFAQYVKDGTIKPFYPAIDEVLRSTGGGLIMQEQITAICHRVFGLSLIDADSIRYAIGKKKDEEMAKWESVILSKGREQGVPEDVITRFWTTCNASADYLFNRSHALLYAYLTAATVLLKARYPLQFYLTMLKLSREEPNPIEYMNQIISEMKVAGIEVLPPSILRSSADFTIEEKAVRFGLQSVKGVSETTMVKLAAFKGEFKTRFEVFEAARAAKVPINVLTSLVYSGCLDTGETPRSYYALNAQLYSLLTDREKPLIHKLAPEYKEDLIAILKDMPNRKDEKGKPLIKETRLETLRRDYASYWTMYKQNSGNEELCSYLMEKNLLGFSYTSTLYGCYSKRVLGLTPLGELVRRKTESETKPAAPIPSADAASAAPEPRAAEGVPPKPTRQEPIKVVCFIDEVKKAISKAKGEPYLRLLISDDSTQWRAMVYGQERVDACVGFNKGLPPEGSIAILTGTLSKDQSLLFADSCVIQPSPIAFKRSEAEAQT